MFNLPVVVDFTSILTFHAFGLATLHVAVLPFPVKFLKDESSENYQLYSIWQCHTHYIPICMQDNDHRRRKQGGGCSPRFLV